MSLVHTACNTPYIECLLRRARVPLLRLHVRPDTPDLSRPRRAREDQRSVLDLRLGELWIFPSLSFETDPPPTGLRSDSSRKKKSPCTRGIFPPFIRSPSQFSRDRRLRPPLPRPATTTNRLTTCPSFGKVPAELSRTITPSLPLSSFPDYRPHYGDRLYTFSPSSIEPSN